MKQLLLLLLATYTVNGDMYIQSLRGSNNRLDEANRERNNANRLFDSQNNDRGGYNVGKLNVFTGEELPFSWTNQHGCNGAGTQDCEIIMQVMFDPIMRDGTTTSTIPTNPANCRNFNCDLDVKYGRHESYEYYKTCTDTERNKGLFLASQNVKGDRAKNTRQNPGGTRRGYECPEERDYYPYWRSSPWVDVAVWTKSIDRCNEYRAESQNVKSRWHCEVPNIVKSNNQYKNKAIPIQEAPCLEWSVTMDNGTTVAAAWMEDAAHGFDPPACLIAEATRENHLGLIGHNRQWTWAFELPDFFKEDEGDEKRFAMRMRYNISEDYAGWKTAESVEPGTDAAQNPSGKVKDAATTPSELPIWETYGLTRDDQETCFSTNNRDATERKEDCREYVFLNNPRPDPFGKAFTAGNDKFRLKFQLAINTAQYGRTFQDRTHMMTMKRWPSDVPEDSALKMVTVGGKRGNIVQTFPAHEYFYYPEKMQVTTDDYLHFMWTGSNTNPNNNDGQGKQGTDRSNIVHLHNQHYEGGSNDGQGVNDEESNGSLGNNYPAFVQQPEGYDLPDIGTFIVDGKEVHCKEPDHLATPIAGFSQDVINQLATGRMIHSEDSDYGNMEELDDSGTTFNLHPVKAKATGCWNYMGSRNNNFSNRSQKGTICVSEGGYKMQDVGAGEESLVTKYGWVRFEERSMDGIQQITVSTEPSNDGPSQVMLVEPPVLSLKQNRRAELGIVYESRALKKPVFMHKATEDSDWNEISEAEFTENAQGKTVGISWVNQGGWYKVEDEVDAGAVIAIVVAVLVFFGVVGYIVYRKWYNPREKKINAHTYDLEEDNAYEA